MILFSSIVVDSISDVMSKTCLIELINAMIAL